MRTRCRECGADMVLAGPCVVCASPEGRRRIERDAYVKRQGQHSLAPALVGALRRAWDAGFDNRPLAEADEREGVLAAWMAGRRHARALTPESASKNSPEGSDV